MKKTINLNVGGMSYIVDDDAYKILNEYISELEAHYSNEDEQEVVKDIEARIAEIFADRLKENHRDVVDVTDVEFAISQLGRPSQIMNEGEEDNSEKSNAGKSRKVRHFYLDKDNDVIGGVCAGMAGYFGIDVIAMRLLWVAALFLGQGITLIAYLIAWAITPAARTAAQKLELRGEEVNVDSISNASRNDDVKSENGLRNALKVILGIILVILAFPIGISLLAILFGLLAAAFGIVSIPAAIGFSLGTQGAIFAIALMLFLIIPIVALVALIVRVFNKDRRKNSKSFWITLLAIWLISLLSMGTVAICNMDKIDNTLKEINEAAKSIDITKYDDWDDIDEYLDADSCDASNTIQKHIIIATPNGNDTISISVR